MRPSDALTPLPCNILYRRLLLSNGALARAAAIWRVIGCKEEDGSFLLPDTERGDTDWYNDASGDAHKGLIRNWVLSGGEGRRRNVTFRY